MPCCRSYTGLQVGAIPYLGRYLWPRTWSAMRTDGSLQEFTVEPRWVRPAQPTGTDPLSSSSIMSRPAQKWLFCADQPLQIAAQNLRQSRRSGALPDAFAAATWPGRYSPIGNAGH